MATMFSCQPVRYGMSTFRISAQVLEQYGDIGGAFHVSYFKPKGGTEYIIHTNGRIYDAIVYVTMLLRQDDDLNTPPIDFKREPQAFYEIVHDWQEVELDHKIDFECYLEDDMEQEEKDELLSSASGNRIIVVMNTMMYIPNEEGDLVEKDDLPTEEDIAAVHAYWTMKGLKWRLDTLPRETD